jgi:ribonuclease D
MNLDTPYHLVETPEYFSTSIQHLKAFSTLAVDFEGEWNLHRYGLHLCLIQVSDGEETFLIDPLSVGNLDPFWEIMEDENICIITHGSQSDIILMDYLYQRSPKNVFDTEKAAQLLNYEGTSLSQLLDRFFGSAKDMKVRVSDWNQRPLTEAMLAYAAKDVAYLHRLREILIQELKEKGRYQWQLEECKALEDIRYKEKENPHLEIPGANKLNDRQAHVLKCLFQIRDRIAKEIDKPSYFVIPNSKLVEFAQNPPKSTKEWTNMGGVNPRVRKNGKEIFAELEVALEEPLPSSSHGLERNYKGLSKTAFLKLADQKTQLLGLIRDQIKEEYDIYPMILSMRSLKKVAYGESTLDDLRDWQKEIVLKTAANMNLDISILSS